MYPILEYSSKYLILEYFAYFHTYMFYIDPVFVLSIYMYILTVSVYTILIHVDSFNTLLIENRCSFVCRSGSQMSVCESHATFCSLDSKIAFLRTRLPWTRTARSIFGCANLFLRLLCIHPSMFHICSHTESLVMTEHNFFTNHARLSNNTCPFSSMTSCMNVFTQLFFDCLLSNHKFTLHGLERRTNHSTISIFYFRKTVHRYVKHIPPCHEQGMQLVTRGFRETVNRLTVQLVQTQTQIVQDNRGSTFHVVADTQNLQH